MAAGILVTCENISKAANARDIHYKGYDNFLVKKKSLYIHQFNKYLLRVIMYQYKFLVNDICGI